MSEPVALRRLFHLLSIGEDRHRHVVTRLVTEHLLQLNLLGVHVERVRNVHRTKLSTLTTVDTGVSNVGKADHLEHEVRRNNSRANQVRLLRRTLDTVADRTVLNTAVAFDTLGGLLHDLVESLSTSSKFCELLLLVLLSHLDHDVLDLTADLKTLCLRCTGVNCACLLCCIKEHCTLVRADLNKGCLSGLLTDDTPVSAGEIALARNLGLTALAVLTAAVAFLFELLNGDTLVLAVLGHNDELTLVDLLFNDIIGVDTILLADHSAGRHRGNGTTTVQTNGDNVVQIDLLAFAKLKKCFCITAFAGDSDFDVLCTVQVLLDEFGQKQGSAVEGTCTGIKVCRVSDEDRFRVVDINALLHSQNNINDLVLKCIFQKGDDSSSALSFDIGLGPCVVHIAFC